MTRITVWVSFVLAVVFVYFSANMHFRTFDSHPDPQPSTYMLVSHINLDALDVQVRNAVESNAKLIGIMNQSIIEDREIACKYASIRFLFAAVLFSVNGIVLWRHNKRLKLDGLKAAT
jgi:hypothetical protein